MIKKLIGSTVLSLSLFINFASAQQFKQFSGKPENFISEIYSFGTNVIEDDQILILRSLKFNWDSIFSITEKEKILLASKCLVEKKARPNPDYFSFLNTLNTFIEKKHPSESFNVWLDVLINLCSIKKTTLSSLLRFNENTYRLLTENIIYQSPSLSWKPSSNNFYYKISEDNLYVIFPSTDLICYAKRDSINIFNTKGKLNPIQNTWKGETGMVTWERAGFSVDTISATLSNYIIDLTKSSYEADSVIFKNTSFFDAPLLGHLEDNVTLIMKKVNASYPKFDSYKKEFVIKNLYDNVDYKGGFSMQGAKLLGKGSLLEPATLEFYRRDTLRLKAKSLFFTFRPEKVTGPDASVSLYMDQDSVYHGDIQFAYNTINKEVSLIKASNYTAQSPYLNSYHNIDMNCEQFTWKIDEPVAFLTTTPGSSIGKAMFESKNFFNNQEFSDLQYFDENHPLVMLKKYAQEVGTNRFSAIEYSKFIHCTMDQVHTLLFPLAVKGYIIYDSSTEYVELKQRLYDNLSASIGRIDYDVLRFVSTTNAPLENGSLDLRTSDLKINGIPSIFVSDSQNVAIFPKDQTITMKRNRNFQFDGVVIAGLFTFFGRNFFFNYDEFKITLKNVDSIRLRVIIGRDNFNKPIYRNVENVIQDITGDVLIDNPGNKSGVKSYPNYPIFNSRGNSYVYYDNNEIFNGVYDRKKEFYFKIYPYELDSLDNFTKEGLKFIGQFSSANIIPVIEEKLILQEDFSLGFKHASPTTGFPLYGDKGKFYNQIHLSNRGLRGNGSISYLASKAKSDDFIFFPDSMNTKATDYSIQQTTAGISYPSVSGNNVKVHWTPYKDNMEVKNTDKPFQMFNKETSLFGTLNMKPKGLFGKGAMDLTTAVTHSENFTFGTNTIDADTSDFKLKSLHDTIFTVSTSNVKGHIDFASRTGKFKSNDPATLTQFPENRYIAQLDEFNWKMDKKQLEMVSLRKNPASTVGEKYGFKDEPLIGAKYISVKKGQDSLSFISPVAVYDYDKNVINATRVKYLEVADARIYPDKELVTIDKSAQMQSFVNAKIMANTTTRFHNIYNANASVAGRYEYEGSGKYDYVDETNKIETITFSNIKADSTKTSVASGDILEPDSFKLSPNYRYQGKVNLKASDKYLNFNGYTQILADCPNYGTSWVQFDTTINPIDIKIPITKKLIEINRKQIVLGTLITLDSIHVYSSFFGIRKNHSDSILTTSDGLLTYDKNNFTYSIASANKLKNHKLSEPLVSINKKTCLHHDEGTVDVGVDLGQMQMKSSGNIDHTLKDNVIKLKLSMALNFFILGKSIDHMALIADSLGRDSINFRQHEIKERYGYLIDSAKLNKYYKDLATEGKIKDIPTPLTNTIILDEVNLVWDDVSNSYHSTGKIGLGYVSGRPIHKFFDGYIEVWRKRSGDIFDLYLQIDNNTYYYFGYTRGTMQVASSDKDFNDPIRELNDNERTLKIERGQTPYTFLMGTERKMLLVRNRWKTGDIDQNQPKEEEQIVPQEQQENIQNMENVPQEQKQP